jgi:hypothetical protein
MMRYAGRQVSNNLMAVPGITVGIALGQVAP